MNMKNNSINADLIEKFRNVVNSNLDFVFQKYKNKNGKNYWNLICSCMDWITVAIIHLQNNSFSKKDINVMTMQVFSYISAIDIVYESIKQLHRAIKGNTILPFHESKYIFSKNNIYKDDNEYFKQIRAAFGAHPVNLNDINGKWFASWPNHAIFDKGYDFELQLYSLDINKEDVIFGLKFAELDSFLLERYSYLLILINEINKQFEEYKNALRKEIIEDNEDTLKLLQILKMESEKRLNNDYYQYRIDKLIRIYSTHLYSETFMDKENDYKGILVKLITEIKRNLQNMELIDLENDTLLNPDYPSEIHYPVSKLFSCDFDSSRNPLFDDFLKELNEYSNNLFDFNSNQPRDELFLKCKLMLYYYKK